jgi:hypothetical protein
VSRKPGLVTSTATGLSKQSDGIYHTRNFSPVFAVSIYLHHPDCALEEAFDPELRSEGISRPAHGPHQFCVVCVREPRFQNTRGVA